MSPVTLSPTDAALLRLAALAAMAEGGPHAAGAERAMAALSDRPEAASPPATEPFARRALRDASGDEGHIDSLARAVTEGRRVTFRYRGGETPADQTRRVDPWGLGYRNGGWYLVGYDADRRDSRVFRVGRIAGEVSVARRRDTFEVPAGMDVARFLAAPPWSFGPVEGPAAEARLLIASEHAGAVGGLLPERMPQRTMDDGRLLVRIMVRDAGSFFDWVLPLGEAAEVAAPSELRAQLAVRLETTAVAWGRG